MEIYYDKETDKVFELIHSREHGLSGEEAAERLKRFGPNALPEAKADSTLLIFARQFASPLIYVLFAASAAVFYLGEIIDGAVILFVLCFNAILGAVQEGKAQNTLLALRRFVQTTASVLRDEKEIILPDTKIVPGDVIILEEGEKIPADARVIVSRSLFIDEAALTGEAIGVSKTAARVGGSNVVLGDQKNMVFKGTSVLRGNGLAVVVATGIETEIGKISKEVSAMDTEIPLKKDIRNLSKIIVLAVGLIVAFVFGLGLFFGKPIDEMFRTAVSLAVSIIPEGLPIVLTLVLATGVWRMSKRHALIKKLQAVEALGQARVIAVDKTGTLTKNEMVIRKVFVDGKTFELSGAGYEPRGETTLDGRPVDPLNHPELILAGRIAAFCASARVIFEEETKTWKMSGDPTEAAMYVLAEKFGFRKVDLEEESPKLSDIPFDYDTKYHLSSHRLGEKQFVTIAGAPEIILNLSRKVWSEGAFHLFSEEKRAEFEKIFHKMSVEGLRIIAFGFSELPLDQELTISNIHRLQNLAFVGFFGMEDSLRPEVAEAMERAREAGIRVVMMTGDHKITAQAIAKQAGIFKEGSKIITGGELEKLSEEELAEILPEVSVFARVSPAHKMKIIQAYKKRGEVIAMTGDGVNDAPSLVGADLGVAMGKIGTEVAKEAADIVLLDDNFGSIISAVEEGRSIYKTIKKVILYLFSTSIGELLTIIGAILLGFPLPILPAQIIWLNLVTDSFLDTALAMEPKEDGLLKSGFERPKRYLVDRLMVVRMFFMSLPMMIGALFLFGRYLNHDLTHAWSISLTTLAVFQWFNAWNCRRESQSIFSKNLLSNKFLIAATFIVILLQLAVLYLPFMQKIFRTEPLSLAEWGIIIAVAFSIIIVEELRKLFYRGGVKNETHR